MTLQSQQVTGNVTLAGEKKAPNSKEQAVLSSTVREREGEGGRARNGCAILHT